MKSDAERGVHEARARRDEALARSWAASRIPRTEVTKKLWDYIKKNKLQDAKEQAEHQRRRKALKAVFGGKKQVTMFEMTKLVGKHLKVVRSLPTRQRRTAEGEHASFGRDLFLIASA